LRTIRARRPIETADQDKVAGLAKLAAAACESIERERDAASVALNEQALHFQTAIDNIAHGLCTFNASAEIVVCNQTYLRMYALSPKIVKPGCTLRRLIEHRRDVGVLEGDIDQYVASILATVARGKTESRLGATADGRTINITNHPMGDGGWVVTHEDISERLRADEEERAKRKAVNEVVSLQTLIDWLPDNVWVKDAASRFVISNNATAVQIGRAGSADLIGKTDYELHPAELAEQFVADERKIIRSGQPLIDHEEYVIDASGAKRWLSTTKVPLRDDRNQIFGLAGISRDITERKLADVWRVGQREILEMIATSAPLEKVLEHLMYLVESQIVGISGSVLLLDKDGAHLRHGAAPSLPKAYASAIDGIRIGPKAGSCGAAVYRRETVIVSDIMCDPLWEDCRELVAAHGHRSCWSTPILSHQGEVLGTFALYSSEVREPTEAELRLIELPTRLAAIAIERKEAEDRIHFMANHDALTGLPNRILLKDRLSQALFHAQRYGRWVAVAFIDLDNFKVVNDSLGHNVGDELLKVVAARMVTCVRSTDTVVRLGGDEFVVILFDQPTDADVIAATVQNIRTAIGEPVRLEGHDLTVTSSVGVAIYPDDGAEVDTLLGNADAAMYRAKDDGRDNFQFYTPDLNTKAHEKFLLQEELRNAVARSEFALLYQPQVDLRTDRVFAVEALIRWNHPTLGTLSPIKFIPLAEESGLIVQIGDWVLHEACRQNKSWQDAGMPPMRVCVNVSARQFREKNLASRVISALRESGLKPEYLELELTESLIMQDVDRAVATMEELQQLGVQISIDDFGTGYSSLSALKTFPVVRLKIDKFFITDVSSDENDKAVACAVISLGQKLNLRVIAEGVETDDQVAFLRANNCDEMQGYHFSRPVSAQEIENLLGMREERSGAMSAPISAVDDIVAA
jgi:diguanylate cyclase (GGDEF)-like protein/PAS domain S-box-containing protein